MYSPASSGVIGFIYTAAQYVAKDKKIHEEEGRKVLI
jgi:hypothetical protein